MRALAFLFATTLGILTIAWIVGRYVLPAILGGPQVHEAAIATPPRASSGGYTLALVPGSNTFTVESKKRLWTGSVLQCGDYEAQWVVTTSAGVVGNIIMTEFHLVEADGDIDQRVVTGAEDILPTTQSHHVHVKRPSTCGIVGKDLPMAFYGTVWLADASGERLTLNAQTGFVER